MFIQFQHFVHSIPPLVHSIPALRSFNSTPCSFNSSTLFIQFQHFVHSILSLRHVPAVGDLAERRAGGGQHGLLRGALQGAVRPPAGGLSVPRPALRCLLPSHGGPQVAAAPLLRPQGPRDAAPLPSSGASGGRHEGQ